MKTTLYTLMLLLALTSCKKEETATTAELAILPSATEAAPANGNATPVEADKAKAATAAYQQMIIKNASLRFETSDLAVTAKKIQDAVTKYQSIVQSDTQGNEGNALARTITVRIPSQYFDAFITDISKGVEYFERREITSEDVSEEYVDTEARLKAKRVLEERYFVMLKKANKVSEILEIEKEIAVIREDIERQQGRINYLKNRVSLSTVTVEFYKATEQQEGITESYTSQMGDAVKTGFNGLSTFVLGLLYIWPIILIFVIVFVVIRIKIKRKKNTDA